MAATLTQERFTGPEWTFEQKLDGIRLLAFKNGSDVRLLSRNRLPQDAAAGVAYHVFDLLWVDGRDVRPLPLEERRAVLAALALRPLYDGSIAPAPRSLGAARDRRPGGLPGVDGARQAAALAAARSVRRQVVARGGEGIAVITHPEKVLFPEDGITKGELAAYYEGMAPVILPHLRGRPITMERYPAGIGRPGFLQKNVATGFPAWLRRVEVPKKDGTVQYPLAGDRQSLLWLANQNSITPHVWASRTPNLHRPDLCVFDLDPSREDPEALRAAALALRDLLAELGVASWVKTSGSKGFHIVIPLDAKAGFSEVARFADTVARISSRATRPG